VQHVLAPPELRVERDRASSPGRPGRRRRRRRDIRQIGPAAVVLRKGMLKMFGEAFGQAEPYGAHRPS